MKVFHPLVHLHQGATGVGRYLKSAQDNPLTSNVVANYKNSAPEYRNPSWPHLFHLFTQCLTDIGSLKSFSEISLTIIYE